MSDSFRFFVRGELIDSSGKVLKHDGWFYIKQEGAWKAYINDSEVVVASFQVGDQTLANHEYNDHFLSNLRSITTTDGHVIRHVQYIGDLVNHKEFSHSP